MSINLLVLDSWKDQIDPTDCLIVALIEKILSSNAEKLQQHKLKDGKGDFIWLDHGYVLKQIPILSCNSKTRIQRRLRKLSKIGLLDSRNKIDPELKKYKAYYRLSKNYHDLDYWWKERLDKIKDGASFEEIRKKKPQIKATVTNDRKSFYS